MATVRKRAGQDTLQGGQSENRHRNWAAGQAAIAVGATATPAELLPGLLDDAGNIDHFRLIVPCTSSPITKRCRRGA
jgi:hypothetical protein